jgi:pseudouridine-5'-phosphate glycosidase
VAVEEEIRKEGGVPATIAILNGVVHIGLTQDEMEALARRGKEVKKCSRRDIAALVGAGDPGSKILGAGTGATTVAATSYLARLAHPDLRVFVTGGIGGVHRGWESTMDISADLTELGRTDITVVCAGAKSILDIPATLEYLETQGVAVVAYQSDFFPSFFTASSGVKAPYRANSPKEIASILSSHSARRANRIYMV